MLIAAACCRPALADIIGNQSSGLILPRGDQLSESNLTDQQLQQMLIANPGNRNAMFVVAARAYLAGNKAQALDVFARIHQLDANFPPPQVAAALVLLDNGKLTEAQAMLTELEASSEHPVWTHIALADVALMQPERQAQVRQQLQLAREADATSELPAVYQSRLFMRQGRPHNAIESLQEAVELAPQRLDLIDQLAGLWFELGYPDETHELLQLAHQRDPGHGVVPALQMARLHWQIQDLVAARQWCRRALEATDAALEAKALYAEVLYHQQETREAEELLLEILTAEPNAFDSAFLLANLYSADRRWVEAKPLYERVFRVSPSHPLVANNLAVAFLELGEQQPRALDLAILAAGQLTQNGKVVAVRGWAYWVNGEIEAAERDLRRAVRLTPGDAWIRLITGNFFAATQRPELARRQWQAGLELKPDERLRADLEAALASE